MKKYILVFIVLFVLFVLTGCYSRSQVDEMQEGLKDYIAHLESENEDLRCEIENYKDSFSSINHDISNISSYVNGGNITKQEAQESIQSIKNALTFFR